MPNLNTHQINTIAITGGCGFVGSHLVKRLLSLGVKRIKVIDSMEYGTSTNLDPISPQVQIVKHCIGRDSFEPMCEVLKDVDILFHLAAEKHNQSIDNPKKVIDVNITGTYNLFRAAASCGVRKTIFTSSLYAYGRMQGPPFTESELPQPQTVYGISKLAGENIGRYFWEQFKLPCVSLRYLFVYGPRQYAHLGYKSVIVKTFQRLLAGQRPIINGDGHQALDYIFVDDAVDATIRAMEVATDCAVVNVASGRGITVLALIDEMQRVAGTNLAPIYASPDSTHASSRVGDTSRMKSMLGFSPTTPLATGLQQTFQWLSTSHTK